ncbi:flagellar hook-length control protein FliK [Buttiauxella izardii]|uniref:Flagellar hook-length control protein FliK n=2 Tax=Buttiauxella izardii TaxID=82991 RepID=A0A3A5JU43_9ENTR|nr:flagellar hook-length control protein FliK [Buttiauxella izardii]
MITSPDVATSTTASGSAISADKGFSEDFLSLLGKALPGQISLADGKTVSLEAALNKTAGKGVAAAADEKATLASLLENLDTSEALSALLANVKKTGVEDKTAQVDAQNEQTQTLSNADMQALSALFAMLPQQTPVTNTLNVQPDAESDAAVSLNTLLAGSGIKNTLTSDARTPATIADKSTARDNAPVAKNAPATSEPLVDSKTFALNNAENGSRDTAANSAANNTSQASTLAAPAFSTATVATPASSQIAVPVAPQISAQLGSQEWQQAVSQHITLSVRQGQQSAELRLHPEDLGQIQISMKLDDNQAQLQMVSAHSHVRAALEATLPNLRIALAESGIELGQSSISSESFAGQQQQSDQQQQQTQRSGGSFPSMGGDAESLAVPASVQRLASGNNAVDIFA